MLDKLLLAKAIIKREKLKKEYRKATGYKKKQLYAKLAEHNRKCFPKLFWDSSKKGTYRKNKRKKINEKK